MKKIIEISISGDGSALEENFADVPDGLMEFYEKNKNEDNIEELIEEYYDEKIMDEWYSFGDSIYGLTPGNSITVTVKYEDGTSETFTDGYEEVNSESEEYEFKNGMIHRAWEKGHLVDAKLIFDNPVEFKIVNIKLNFDNESCPAVLESISYENENELLACDGNLYSMLSTRGKGIDVEIKIDSQIVFSA